MRRTSWFVLGAAIASGCGREDVQLLQVIDGSPGNVDDHADALGEVAGNTPTEDAAANDDVREDAPGCPVSAVGRSCRENGTTCIIDAECCSSRCSAGVCLEAGVCAGPGAACTARDACCSGRCEPVVGTTNRTCLNYCLADGAACSAPLDCCSMGCQGGTCGPPLCGAEGAPCAAATDCCSELCSASEGLCRSGGADTICRSTGESCDDDDGDAASAQCCGACDSVFALCDFGPGPCLPSGSLCETDADCCRGTCAEAASGVTVCMAPCLPDGTACTSGADCCNHHCNGVEGMCGSATTCNLLGAHCTADTQCCSGQCLGDACGTSCPIP